MRVIVTCALIAVLIALAVAWSVTPLARVFDPHAIAGYEHEVRSWSFAPLIVVLVYVASGLIVTPVTLTIGATALLFGPLLGSLYAFAGMLVEGSVVYAIGRYAARDLIDQWLAKRVGSKLDLFNRQLERRGFIAIALMRLTPTPYTLQNVLAGASRIRLRDFLLGTAIGILPVIALMAGLASEFDAWLVHPDWIRLSALIAALVAALAIGWMLTRWAARRTSGR
jgi:phospholipase D1/2